MFVSVVPKVADSSAGLQIELLGPVELRVEGRVAVLGGRQARTLLAVLALESGRVVSVDRLIDELWDEHPPAAARENLQVNVSRLRKAFTTAGGEGDRIVYRAGGYLLELRPGERDVDRWQSALAGVQQARADGEPHVARVRIDEALSVWRGRPLGGAAECRLVVRERARLEEEQLAAIIAGIELDLELGRHGEILGQLDALVVEYPFTERLVELQMRALHRCGRQSDALSAFRAARDRFVQELGIEPGRSLRELNDALLRDELPPVETVAERPARAMRARAILPAPPNATIGRERDLGAVANLLRSESVRLLTLIGPGGVGKSRLAVEAARMIEADFADGARFISLAELTRGQDVLAAIVDGVRIVALAGESAVQTAERFLVDKQLLLVVDNFEHVLGGSAQIGALLRACPMLTVLATSREPLALHAETRHVVAPLATPGVAMPEDPRKLADVAAVALFCERARARDPEFRLADADAVAIAKICRRVEGLPLAIELAAARCGLLSPREIAERLDATYWAPPAGPRDAPQRQRSVRATIDWSFDLLDAHERACYSRFAVFAGGATVDAAERVAGADVETLDALVAKSMLLRRRQRDAPTRLAMLEMVRAHAGEHLDASDEAPLVRERHHDHFLKLACRHGGERALWGPDGAANLAALDADLPNLYAALAWAIGEGLAAAALRMCEALGPYWLLRNRYADALEWIDRSFALPQATVETVLRVRPLCDKAWCLWATGRGGERGPVLDEAEALAREALDARLVSCVLGTRATFAAGAGRFADASALADEALGLATSAGDAWAIAIASEARALASDDPAELAERVNTAAALLESESNMYVLGGLLASAAYTALRKNRDGEALAFAERAIPIARELDNPYGWMLLHGNLGLAKLLTDDTEGARGAFRTELTLCRELGVRPLASEGLLGLAAVAAVQGDTDRAARLAGASRAHAYGAQQHDITVRLEATFLSTARQRRQPDKWQLATREGGRLSYEDALAYALEERHQPHLMRDSL